MGRHSVQAGESFGIVIDTEKMPLPGSRRAARLAALAQASASTSDEAGQKAANQDRKPSVTHGAPDESHNSTDDTINAVTFVEAVIKPREEETTSPTPENENSGKTGHTPLLSVVGNEKPAEHTPHTSEVSQHGSDTVENEGNADNANAALSQLPTQEKTAKRPFFSLFNRSRAVVVALVAAASGVAAAGTASLTPRSADAEPLTINGVAPANTAMLPTNFASQGTSVTFTVTVDGQTRQITTTATTLHEALREAGIIIDDDDKVSQLVETGVYDGANVVITRVEKKTSTEEVTDAHSSSEVEDDTLARGQKKVETKGVDGLTLNTYEVVYEDGQEVGRHLLISTVKEQRVDEVVKVGTREEKDAVDTSGAVAVPAGDSQQIAYGMLGSYGWDSGQFSCLVNLWNKESNWNHLAQNRSSSAYGIPQALPGSKMASAGADWATNPATQIKWGLGYISGRYGSPCAAWGHSQRVGWY